MTAIIYLKSIENKQELKLIDMNNVIHPFVFKYSEEKNIYEYFGSDSLPIAETYNLYMEKCEEFKVKAKKYAKDNLCLKTSYIPHTKFGYQGSEQSEEEVLLERKEHMMEYRKAFNINSFDEDANSMYECFKGKSKRIRIIRELQEERMEEFSVDFDKKRTSWFKRYCTLSKFIQAARKIILLNRLEKALAMLRTQVPEMIRKTEEKEAKAKEMKAQSERRKCCEHKLNVFETEK